MPKQIFVSSSPQARFGARPDYWRIVARLDRKRLGQDTLASKWNSIRGVFDKQTRRKPLVFAADAVRYGI
jgi:hypothetical protein